MKNAASRFGWRKYLVFLLLSGGILGLMVFFSIKVFGFLYHEQEFPLYFKLFLSEKILMMTFLTMFLMLILSALISTLNIFFLSLIVNTSLLVKKNSVPEYIKHLLLGSTNWRCLASLFAQRESLVHPGKNPVPHLKFLNRMGNLTFCVHKGLFR